MKLLEGKVAIITGSGRGIGKSMAELFADEGAAVAINDIDADVCNATVAELKGKGFKAIACKADVTKDEDVKKMVDDTVAAFGTVDILVNNAGITKDAMFHKMDDKLWNFIQDVNLLGTILCCKHVIPIMQAKQSGKIVNTASTTGLMGNIGQTNYAAAKGGVIGFTKGLARELAMHKINVNCYGPGFVETRLTAVKADGGDRSGLGIPKGVRDSGISAIPFGRIGQPVDVAKVALFFASTLSDYVTGEVISVSGGLLI
ncbi:MAG: 3-oxoacyl-ACP reductase FabG [Candidatus Lokiarchaeota archaeon]|nr:3-oxoacyl-ACP reductase FabG [Candidatus Lokiarchaeota archaeon]